MHTKQHINFYIQYDKNTSFYISKDIDTEIFKDYILNFYGELKIGRSNPKELDVLVITYTLDDRTKVEQELLNL